MLEEEKVVEAEVVAEEEPAQAQAAEPVADQEALKKNALMAFIFALVAMFLCESAILGIIFAAISLKKVKAAAGVTANPQRIFVKIAKPVAIVALVCSIVAIAIYAIVIPLTCGAALCAAAVEDAASTTLVLF